MPRSVAARVIAIAAWPRSNWARPYSLSAAGPMITMVAAECATWPAPTHTLASSVSCARSVTRMKSHGCQFCDEGDRRPASRIWARSAADIGRAANERTVRRAVIASEACMSSSTRARAQFISAGDDAPDEALPSTPPARSEAASVAQVGRAPCHTEDMGWYEDHVLPRVVDISLRSGDFARVRASVAAELAGEVLGLGFAS